VELGTILTKHLLIHSDTTNATLHNNSLIERELPWLTLLTKWGSRDVEILGIPVSAFVRQHILHVIRRFKCRDNDYGLLLDTWFLKQGLRHPSDGERGRRLVSATIRHRSTLRDKIAHDVDYYLREDQANPDWLVMIYGETGSGKTALTREDLSSLSEHGIALQKTSKQWTHVASSFRVPKYSEDDIKGRGGTHPKAAFTRHSVVTAARKHIKLHGLQQWDPSVGETPRDRGAGGTRIVHWAKDLEHADPNTPLREWDVVTLIDCDYYIDDFSQYEGHKILVITNQYTKLAGGGNDSNYWFHISPNRGDVVVCERVAGAQGTTYDEQRPWDWFANEIVYIEDINKTRFTIYKIITQVQPGTHRLIVWLCPLVTTFIRKAVVDAMMVEAFGHPLEAAPLRKIDNVVIVKAPGHDTVFLLGRFGTSGKPYFSIKRNMDTDVDCSMETSEFGFHLFHLMGRLKMKGYGVNELERANRKLEQARERPKAVEPLIADFFRIDYDFRPMPNLMYVRLPGSEDDDDECEKNPKITELLPAGQEPKAVRGMPNIAGGYPGVVDSTSREAYASYEELRLKAFRNDITPPEKFLAVADKLLNVFIDLVARDSGVDHNSLGLCGAEYIYEIRTQRLQAMRLAHHKNLMATETLAKTFLKNEVTDKCGKAPRGITQLSEGQAIETGRLSMLLKYLLKRTAWYMPGQNPQGIGEAIKKLAGLSVPASTFDGECMGMHDTDYSKMDETISYTIYQWFVKFTLAFIHPSDKEEAAKILKDNANMSAFIGNKIARLGWKNVSGSGYTTELNTFVSAFVEFTITNYAIARTYLLEDRATVFGAKTPGEQASGLFDASTPMGDYTIGLIKKGLKWHVAKHWDNGNAEDWMIDADTNAVRPWAVAYSVIGPKFGDDGIGAALKRVSDRTWAEAAEHVTSTIGMILKVTFSRPEDGTFFLGRWYPVPLESATSYADVVKALRKLHIASSTDAEKYKAKLCGYWVTDSQTPVLREYLLLASKFIPDFDIEAYRHKTGIETDESGNWLLSADMVKLLNNDRDSFYRIAGGPYEFDEEHLRDVKAKIAEQTGFDVVSDFETWLDGLAACQTVEELDRYNLPEGVTEYDPDNEPDHALRVEGPTDFLLPALRTRSGPYELIDGVSTFAEMEVSANCVINVVIIGALELCQPPVALHLSKREGGGSAFKAKRAAEAPAHSRE